MVELGRMRTATDNLWHYRADQFDPRDLHNPQNN